MDRLGLRYVGPVVLLYLFLAAGSAATRLPQSDEGRSGIPAWHLAFEGRLVNPVVVPVQAYHQGIDRKTYMGPTLHYLELAASFRIAGFGLFQARAVSVFWGLVAVLASAQLLWALTGSIRAGEGPGALWLADLGLLSAAANSRSNTPCLRSVLAGLALYFDWRGRSLQWAAFLGNALVAIGCFIHPNGLAAFVFLQGATVTMDRTRLTKEISCWRRYRMPWAGGLGPLRQPGTGVSFARSWAAPSRRPRYMRVTTPPTGYVSLASAAAPYT